MRFEDFYKLYEEDLKPNRVGHESQTITFHYAHMFPTEQIEMADKLNEEFVPGTGNGGGIQ